MTSKNLAGIIGALIKNMTDLHDREHEGLYDITEATFFQKFVTQQLMDKGVRIKQTDYLKGLVFLTYHSSVFDDSYKVCDDLVEISKEMRKIEKETHEENQMSYLPLDVVVLEAGLCAAEKGPGHYFDAQNLATYKANYQTYSQSDSGMDRQHDIYYEGLGRRVCDLVSFEKRDLLRDAKNRADISAIVFCDSALSMLSKKSAAKVEKLLSAHEYFSASVEALDSLAKESTIPKLESYLIGDANGD